MVALSTLRSLVLAVPFLQNSFEVRGESPDGDSISTLKNRLLQFSDTEFQYLSECENTLLGESVIKDGLISQQDFSDAYQSFCSKYSAGADCPKGRFQGLPPRLQFLFYEAVCETMPYPEQCAKRLNTLNTMAFGYIVSDDTMAKVQMNVERLCLEMIEHVFSKYTLTISRNCSTHSSGLRNSHTSDLAFAHSHQSANYCAN